LEALLAKGQSLNNITSVASFFLSRIDLLVVPMLQQIVDKKEENSELAKALQGQIAIACAKIAYQKYNKLTNSKPFKTLADAGAKTQRLLWASTSSKNPKDSDIKYVEALIGVETINTIPLETLEAYRDNGNPQPALTTDIDKSNLAFDQLPKLGINMDKVTQQLEDEGVDKFIKSFDQLIETLKEKIEKFRA
jgi:transaldolase